MKNKIYVGFESTMDKIFTIPSIEEIKKISNKKISNLIKKVIKYLSMKEDREIPIDNFEYKKDLENSLKPYETFVSLGGNAAIEASSFHSLGSNVKFIGTYSTRVIRELKEKNPSQLKHFLPTISRLSKKVDGKPTSYIIQVIKNPSRIILCDGYGRRYKHVKSIFKNIKKLKGYVSLVGWHVVFAYEKCDYDVISFMDRLKKSSKIFSDMGPMSSQKMKNLSKVLFKSNVISMNESEFETFKKAFGSPKKVMEKSNLDSIYVHTHRYQWSISRNREIAEMMKKAQTFSSAAATHRIETLSFPTSEDVRKVMKRAKKSTVKKSGKFYTVKTNTIKPKKIISTVGAGDVAFSSLIKCLMDQGF